MEVKEFIEARLAELESIAFHATPGPWSEKVDRMYTGPMLFDKAHIVSNDPVHVIRQIAAIRRVMLVLDGMSDLISDLQAWGFEQAVANAYHAVAWIWRDHPDHDPAWAPDGWLQVAVGGDT